MKHVSVELVHRLAGGNTLDLKVLFSDSKISRLIEHDLGTFKKFGLTKENITMIARNVLSK